jgi:hypothetical protein
LLTLAAMGVLAQGSVGNGANVLVALLFLFGLLCWLNLDNIGKIVQPDEND